MSVPPNESQQHVSLLRELVRFLHLNYSVQKIEGFERKTESMSLSDLKIKLSPLSQQYFGNLLQPANQRILENFIQITHPHAQFLVDWDSVMRALEFAYATEIKALQDLYDSSDSPESWGKRMTSEEHRLLLSKGLTSKEEIKKYIKKLFAEHKKKNPTGKRTVVKKKREESPDAEDGDLEETMGLTLFEDKALHKIIVDGLPSALLLSQGAERRVKKIIMTKPKPPPKPQEEKDQDQEDEGSGEEADRGGGLSFTRQKSKELQQFIHSCPLPAVPPLVNHFADAGRKVYVDILRKRDEMLDTLKELQKEYKELRPIVHFWTSGFDRVYLFWINLQIENASAPLPTTEAQTWLSTYYTPEDDIHFVLLVGQPQAGILHKMQYHLNHSGDDLLRLPTTTEDAAREEEEEDYSYEPSSMQGQQTEVQQQLWKDYLVAVSGGGGVHKTWKHNYRFFSIKLFRAMHTSKIAYADVHQILDSAFETCNTSSKDIVAPLHSVIQQRSERYTAICKQIAKDMTAPLKPKGHGKHVAAWAGKIHWEPYWNLMSILRQDHPLVKLLLRKRSPPPKQKAQIVRKGDASAAMDNSLLDAKTKDRLYQWWSTQVWKRVCSEAEIPLT
jgi:hypothetical protein